MLILLRRVNDLHRSSPGFIMGNIGVFHGSLSTVSWILSCFTGVPSPQNTESAQPIQSDEEDEAKEPNCLLLEPDFQLMRALMGSQQNFTISDPSMPDNPIVYASQARHPLKTTNYEVDYSRYTVADQRLYPVIHTW